MVVIKIINIHILIMVFSVSAVKHSHGIEDLNMYLNFKNYYTASIYYYKLIITLLKIEKKVIIIKYLLRSVTTASGSSIRSENNSKLLKETFA